MALKPSTMDFLEDLVERHPDLADTLESISHAVDLICMSCRSGGKVLVCGNGGSAADSEHIVGELMKGFILRRELPDSDLEKLKNEGFDDWHDLANHLQRGIPAIALTGHASLSTAVMNDTDPYMIFAQQAYVYGKPGDVLIGLSTSGNATNVVNALKVARAFGLKTIGLTGNRRSKMDVFCDVMIKAPDDETYKVQEYHLPIYHTICMMIEQELFGE